MVPARQRHPDPAVDAARGDAREHGAHVAAKGQARAVAPAPARHQSHGPLRAVRLGRGGLARRHPAAPPRMPMLVMLVTSISTVSCRRAALPPWLQNQLPPDPLHPGPVCRPQAKAVDHAQGWPAISGFAVASSASSTAPSNPLAHQQRRAPGRGLAGAAHVPAHGHGRQGQSGRGDEQRFRTQPNWLTRPRAARAPDPARNPGCSEPRKPTQTAAGWQRSWGMP